MKILLNYADGKFLQSQLKNSQSGLAAGFNVVYQMSRSEIDSEFAVRHDGILSQKRGAGYWLWKSYFINKILHNMDKNDILFYSDSGSIFVRRVEPIFQAVIDDPKGIIGFALVGGHLEKYYTKRDLFIHMGMNTIEYTDTPQRMASFMCFRKTPESVAIALEYSELVSNPHLITDTPNKDGWVESGFIDHRHDQSIWSLLTKKHGITILPDPTQWGVQHGENTAEHQYLFHTRDSK